MKGAVLALIVAGDGDSDIEVVSNLVGVLATIPRSSEPQPVEVQVPPGLHEITVTAKDSAGNITRTESFIIDRRPPRAPSVKIVSEPGASGIELAIGGALNGTATVTSTFGVENVRLDGRGAGRVTIEATSDGVHTLTVTTTDKKGQVSPESSVSAEVDTTGPLLTVTLDDREATRGSAVLLIVSEPGSEIRIAPEGSDPSSSVLAGTTVRTPLELPVGSSRVAVTATDRYGNDVTVAGVVTIRETLRWSLIVTVLALIVLVIASGLGIRWVRRRRRSRIALRPETPLEELFPDMPMPPPPRRRREQY